MTSKQDTNSPNNFKSLKSSFVIPLKIKMFYSMLEDASQKNNSPTVVSKDLIKKNKLLISIFKRLSQAQQERFLYQTLKIVKSSLSSTRKEKQDSNSSESDGMDLIKDIQTTCKVKESFLGFTKWEKKGFKFNTKTCKVKLTNGKKQSVFNLPYYLVRKSKTHPKTVTLQSTSDSIQPSKSQLYLQFDSTQLFQQIYNHLFTCIVQSNAKQFLRLSNQRQQKQKQKQKQNQLMSTNTNTNANTNDEMSKASIILTSKILNEYFQMKDKIMRKLQNCSYKFESVETSLANTKIGVSRHKNKARIKIQRVYNNMTIQQLAKNLSLINRKTDSQLIQFQVLQIFSSNINVVYFKYYFNSQVYQFLTILQQNSRNDEIILTFKGIDNFINKQFVDFISIRIKDMGQGQLMMKLMGIVKNQQKNKNQAVDFLLSLIDPQQNKQIKQMKQEEFWTVRQVENMEMEESDQFYGNALDQQAITKRNEQFQQQSKTTDKKLIRKKYILQPDKPTNIFLTEHPLFKEWIVHKNGGVLCTDQQQVNVQKKTFKYIISKIGSNIIQRKNILNVSFPVTIFKKQSHLKSVARNFSFASIFLQKVVKSTPLQKIKAVVLFQISTAILVISMNKPFNPILGQTYQGFIDGCPIFLEQVSHHPPVSKYLFLGRGFKIHGTIQPKVAIGLNCVKGWSPPLNYLEFDDGTHYQFTMNKMVINGMLFGQRTFNFEGANFIIDHKNKLAAQICYGSQGSTAFKKKQLACDSVSGAIYDLSTYNDKIVGTNFKKNQKQRLSTFNGIWHNQIRMDGVKVYNFQSDLPHALIDHQCPIPSDSKYRSDLNELIKGDLENAQRQKDFLQEIQRRDKRLRETCKNDKNH